MDAALDLFQEAEALGWMRWRVCHLRSIDASIEWNESDKTKAGRGMTYIEFCYCISTCSSIGQKPGRRAKVVTMIMDTRR